jgi:hypothetical protein
VYPCYLIGYQETLNSIEKCRNTGYKTIALPHRGIADAKEVENFFEKSHAAIAACRAFILGLKEQGQSEEEMLDAFFAEYGSDVLLTFQPKAAFYANAKATIACTLAEIQK